MLLLCNLVWFVPPAVQGCAAAAFHAGLDRLEAAASGSCWCVLTQCVCVDIEQPCHALWVQETDGRCEQQPCLV